MPPAETSVGYSARLRKEKTSTQSPPVLRDRPHMFRSSGEITTPWGICRHDGLCLGCRSSSSCRGYTGRFSKSCRRCSKNYNLTPVLVQMPPAIFCETKPESRDSLLDLHKGHGSTTTALPHPKRFRVQRLPAKIDFGTQCAWVAFWPAKTTVHIHWCRFRLNKACQKPPPSRQEIDTSWYCLMTKSK